MKWHEALSGLMSGTALLLPLTAASESHLQTGSASAVSSTTAHVNFKIVIPQVLYLQVGAGKAIAADLCRKSRKSEMSVLERRAAVADVYVMATRAIAC